MKKIVVVSEKPWNVPLLERLKSKLNSYDWILINKRKDFIPENLKRINPEKIFIPHWSYIIPETIFSNFECIVFHMTDLPFGRGGSPLQNLIARGYAETKISALRVEKGIDTGPVYLKEPLSLSGTAQEIFIKSARIVEGMIVKIVENNIKPRAQDGEVVVFRRRKPSEGNLEDIKETQKIYDFIRMLDCEGYPSAFIENEYFRFEFSRASLKSEKEIMADVRIIKK